MLEPRFQKYRWTKKPLKGQACIDRSHSLARNLKLVWLLNEAGGQRIHDVSGPNHQAAFSGAVWSAGLFGPAVRFDGTTNVLIENVNSNDVLKEDQVLSISAWIYPITTGGGTFGRILDRSEAGLGTAFAMSDTATLRVIIDGATDLVRDASDNSLLLNSWSHVGMSRDGTTNASNVRIYVNGRETTYKTTINGVGLTDNADARLRMGNNPGETLGFNGWISHVFAWERILHPNEWIQLYQDPFCFFLPPMQRRFWWDTEPAAVAAGTWPGYVSTPGGYY